MNLHFNQSKRLIQRALRPFVSLLIRNGISHRHISDLLKVVYVDVAAKEYGKGGRPTNVTRISLLTGIDRKQVKALRDHAQNEPKPIDEPGREALEDSASSQSSVLGRVLSAWYQDPEFSADGQPQGLEVDGAFAKLCKRYGGDKTRTAILNELFRVEAVQRINDNKVIAVTRYYMPASTDAEALVRSLDVYRDLGNTLLHNLYRDEAHASQFEGRVTNSEVPISQIADFRAHVAAEGQQFLERIDARLSEFEENAHSDEQRARLGLGVYWIEDQTEVSK